MTSPESGSGEPVPAPTDWQKFLDDMDGPMSSFIDAAIEDPNPNWPKGLTTVALWFREATAQNIALRRRIGVLEGEARVRGEPSREPTLEEIVRETEEVIRTCTLPIRPVERRLPWIVGVVRARLSSPEAPR